MKKWLCFVLVSLGLVVALAACSNNTTVQDGTYTAQADDNYTAEKGYGWRDTLTVTVQGGKVASATYDAFDVTGNAKSVPGNYEGMEPPPADWMPQLSQNVVEAGWGGKVDGVAGASISSENVQKMLDALAKDGKAGGIIDVAL